MLKAQFAPCTLHFRQPARTSRQVMTEKQTFFIKVFDSADPGRFGIGECALFRGLSADDVPDYEDRLAHLCAHVDSFAVPPVSSVSPFLLEHPSMRFGLETALLDLVGGGTRTLFSTPWSRGEQGIEINGLVWMGTIDQMNSRIEQKLGQGFRCIKFKIGGEDFDSELALLSQLRSRFAPERLEIRLDANGAFTPDEALDKLSELSRLHIHSIEQPIRPGQRTEMTRICRQSPIPVALDEELIGIDNPEDKLRLLSEIAPRYIILKPALCGGISGAMEWISLARLSGTGWWATSALESNVGLNAIAQWVATLAPTLPQGLGTGQLYTDNIPSPLEQKGTKLFTNPALGWDLTQLQWQS